jgi:ribosome recycling factor
LRYERFKLIGDVLTETDNKMVKAVDTLKKELAGIRTGRARPGLVEHIRVDYYGVPTPLNQIANVSAPEARLLVIQPWDRQSLSSIEKAIMKSDLGLNPTSDGNVIRLIIPQLTEERRKELVRMVRRRVEEGKVALRNVRREALEQLRDRERNKEISEDERERASEQLQKLTDSFMVQVDQLGQDKEAELLEV